MQNLSSAQVQFGQLAESRHYCLSFQLSIFICPYKIQFYLMLTQLCCPFLKSQLPAEMPMNQVI